MRVSSVVTLLGTLLSLTSADLKLTNPTKKTEWEGASTVSIQWEEDGSPGLADFDSYSLYLCWGSNDAASQMCNFPLGPPGSKLSASTTQAKVPIPNDMFGNGDEVFFIKMLAVGTKGDEFATFSERFSISGMKGTFDAAAKQQQTQSKGKPPPDNVDKTSDDSAPADGGAAMAKKPYTEQTGKTRYAPMQTQPGSVIKSPLATRRQYPTSEFTVFKTRGPKPTVQTTITQSWDYQVTHKINTASPAPRPDAQQKVLNRWRD